MNLVQSLAWFERARVIPGRSLTRSKAPGRLFDVGAGPLYATGGDGAILTDADGNRYIDMLCALGAISLGYRSEEELRTDYGGRLRLDSVYSLPSTFEAAAAERVIEIVAPWASQVRFVKTGSEATHAAYRIARAATGRKHVLIGDWAYHGWHEWCQETDFPYTHRYPHGDLFTGDEHGEVGSEFDHCLPNEVAAVFVEPHRWAPVDPSWLAFLRGWCDRTGALLVFDEMIYGGRWAVGGAAAYFAEAMGHVRPDLACYGKALGNGAPIAFVVGGGALALRGELVSGTYSGDAGALAKLVAVLGVYQSQPVIETLWRRGRQLARGLREALAGAPPGTVLEGEPVHQRLRFQDPALGRAFAAAMARHGVLWHPDCVNVCYSHTEALIERVVEAAFLAMRGMDQ